jgi:hypothetical protein
MSDIKNLLDIVEEFSEDEGLVEAQDSFDIELGEDLLIETGVVDINEDGILVEGDEETLALLEQHGITFEETDWSKYDEPTINRIKKGVTKPVDRTDYNTPPAMRDKTLGMTGPEKRRASLIAQGILKATDVEEALDLKDLRAAAKKVAPVAPAQVAPVDNKDKAPATEVPKTKDGKLDLNALRDLVKEEEMDEAKYQGREVPLGKPMAGDVKKRKVYVRKPNPKRRKSFRARHNCKNPGPRWKARYWSCRAW